MHSVAVAVRPFGMVPQVAALLSLLFALTPAWADPSCAVHGMAYSQARFYQTVVVWLQQGS